MPLRFCSIWWYAEKSDSTSHIQWSRTSYGLASWYCSSSLPHQESAGAFKEEGEILVVYSDFYHLYLFVMFTANMQHVEMGSAYEKVFISQKKQSGNKVWECSLNISKENPWDFLAQVPFCQTVTEWQSGNFLHWLVTVAKPVIFDSTSNATITKTAWGEHGMRV